MSLPRKARESKKLIALIDGQQVEYGFCRAIESEKGSKPENDRQVYLGEGKIYSINGHVQNGERRYYFFKIKR